MLMFVAAFLTFMAIGGFPAFVEDMKVVDERLPISLTNGDICEEYELKLKYDYLKHIN
jgi:uncharacterized membrane protein YqhA